MEKNPLAIPSLKRHHIRRLERRLNYLRAEIAQYEEYPGRSYDRSEAAALEVAVAELTEIYEQRRQDEDEQHDSPTELDAPPPPC